MRELVAEAHERFRHISEGQNAQIYPALAKVSRDLFGISVVTTNGEVFEAGDAGYEFPMMSVAKPFVFALVCDAIGAEEVRQKIGVNSTGLPYNSVSAIERADGKTNPMVNAGAMATTTLVPGDTVEAKWQLIRETLSRFAGRTLSINSEVYESVSQTNHRNRAIANLLQSRHRLYLDAADAVDLYSKQSSLNVTARDLAVMGATLANGGANPLMKIRVIDAKICRYTLAVMATAGMYETSGDWLYDVGAPGKSGIGGGIVVASPGRCGLGTFAPPLDDSGNSVKGQLVAKFLSERMGLDILSRDQGVRRF